ncbi:nucleoside-triphosphatase [uncultured Winogradskyella sp.]|uniref:nucleoside-triphosphatase n=1 Tax=uncultured Winogradskyella sp. TaxID=395353 RepID=UPI002617D230|nr:nucleoside-triphosphatase [uncultured Winogradskyella sp.]
MIYILTGDIRTGKTSALLDWTKDRNDVDGLLCPDDENGKRYFLKIKSQEKLELEVESQSEMVITIGPFHFLKSVFKEANKFLIALSLKTKSQYLIIDELGKLELKNKGLHDAAEKLVLDYVFNGNRHLILVVRTSLLEEIVNYYQIEAYTLLVKEDLKTIV